MKKNTIILACMSLICMLLITPCISAVNADIFVDHVEQKQIFSRPSLIKRFIGQIIKMVVLNPIFLLWSCFGFIDYDDFGLIFIYNIIETFLIIHGFLPPYQKI